jgi:hypothetical protein
MFSFFFFWSPFRHIEECASLGLIEICLVCYMRDRPCAKKPQYLQITSLCKIESAHNHALILYTILKSIRMSYSKLNLPRFRKVREDLLVICGFLFNVYSN